MSDLAKQLRKMGDGLDDDWHVADAILAREAADEIERLRAEKKDACDLIARHLMGDVVEEENVRLRATLDEVRNSITINGSLPTLVSDLDRILARAAETPQTGARGGAPRTVQGAQIWNATEVAQDVYDVTIRIRGSEYQRYLDEMKRGGLLRVSICSGTVEGRIAKCEATGQGYFVHLRCRRYSPCVDS